MSGYVASERTRFNLITKGKGKMIRQIVHQGVGGLKTINDDCVGQLKYDGAMYHLHIKNRFGYALTSKRVSVKTNELNEKWNLFSGEYADSILCNVKKETIFVCEAVSEHLRNYKEEYLDFVWDRRVSFVAGIMNSKPETMYEKYESNPLRFVVFDVLYYDGVDVRDEPYGIKYNTFIRPHFPQAGMFGERIELKNNLCYAVTNVKRESIESYYGMCVRRGFEGIVVKDKNSNLAMKMKKLATADCIIIGFTQGTGKYQNMIGAVEVGIVVKDQRQIPFRLDVTKLNRKQVNHLLETGAIVKVGQASGMDDYMRKQMSDFKNAYLGKPVEIAYKEFSGKKMIHPRFKQVRFDKYITRCTMEQFTNEAN